MENKSRGRSREPNDKKFNGRSQSRDRSQFKEIRECFYYEKNGHLQRDCWHQNKEQTEGKDKKNNSEKYTATAVIVEDVVVLFFEEQKCEHVANNDVEWVVDSATSHQVIPRKGLFTTYKVGDFGTMKMDNSSYSKIVEISDVYQNQCWQHHDVEGCATCSRFKDECVFYISYGPNGLL